MSRNLSGRCNRHLEGNLDIRIGVPLPRIFRPQRSCHMMVRQVCTTESPHLSQELSSWGSNGIGLTCVGVKRRSGKWRPANSRRWHPPMCSGTTRQSESDTSAERTLPQLFRGIGRADRHREPQSLGRIGRDHRMHVAKFGCITLTARRERTLGTSQITMTTPLGLRRGALIDGREMTADGPTKARSGITSKRTGVVVLSHELSWR